MTEYDQRHYDTLFPLAEKTGSAIREQVETFLRDEHPEVDLYAITRRTKSWDSIQRKMSERKKIKNFMDCEDLVGLRVICHCLSDSEAAVRILEKFLKKTYSVHGTVVTKNVGRKGYNAVHFVFKCADGGTVFPCEIQVKSVLRDAWAIQSRRFLYGKQPEGDSDRLSLVASGILENCEILWELIKEKNGGGTIDKAEEVSQVIGKEITHLELEEEPDANRYMDILRRIPGEGEPDLEDLLEEEMEKINTVWNETYQKATPGNKFSECAEPMELAMRNIKLLGLLAIRQDKPTAFKKILSIFPKIAALSNGLSGYTALISIPFHILHNTYYLFGAFSLKKERVSCLVQLLSLDLTWTFRNDPETVPIWNMSVIFAPDILRSAELTFNRLLDYFETQEPKEIKDIVKMQKEDLTTLACQFNLLFCLKAMQLQQKKEEDYVWAYPNFARYYASRVQGLIQSIKAGKEPYAQLIREAFGEDLDKFNGQASERLKILSERGLGSAMWWNSIRAW